MPGAHIAAPRRVAVVGTGYFSQYHLQAWAGLDGARLVALCDRDAGRVRDAAQRSGVQAVYTDLATMLRQAQPELLDVIVPPAQHAEVLRQALECRVPVICQKPFGSSYAQAVELTAAFEAAGVPLVIHENFRFMPWFRETRRLIDAGMLGTPHGVSFRLRPGDGQGPRAYLDRQPYFQSMPRLLVVETAVHFIDSFRFLLGEVSAVYARLRRINPVLRGEDAGLITLEFASGATGLIDGNRCNDHSAANPRRTMGEMWLEGSAGVLRLDGDARLWWKPHHGPEQPHPYDAGPDQGFGGGACGALQQHVLQHLQDGSVPDNTARAYLRNLRIQEAAYESHLRGCRIEIDSFEPPAQARAVL